MNQIDDTKPTALGWLFELRMLGVRLSRRLRAVFPWLVLALALGCAGPDRVGFQVPGFSWPGTPKRVFLDAAEAYRPALDGAMAFWNRELGLLALVGSEESQDWDVWVAIDEPLAAGLSRSWVRDDQRLAEIRLAPGDLGTVYTQLCHELGHAAFGLADDIVPGSVMVPQSAEQRFVVTSEDRALVRAALGAKP